MQLKITLADTNKSKRVLRKIEKALNELRYGTVMEYKDAPKENVRVSFRVDDAEKVIYAIQDVLVEVDNKK
jgi:hypothetical protein